MLESEKAEGDQPKRGWSKTLDLDRKTLTSNFVNRMETCLRTIEEAQDDLKEICAEANEAEYSKRDVQAMKKIAQLRLKDQIGRAKEQLDALQRVSRACGLDLFDWADTSH